MADKDYIEVPFEIRQGRRYRRIDEWDQKVWGDTVPNAKAPTFLYVDFQLALNEHFRNIEIGMNYRLTKEQLGGKDAKSVCRLPEAIFFAMTKHIRDMVSRPEEFPIGHSRGYEITTDYLGNKRLDAPMVEAVLAVGKDDEGIWITLRKRGYPHVKCYFSQPKRWRLRGANGEVLTNFQISCEMAYSITTSWDSAVNDILNTKLLTKSDYDTAIEVKKNRYFKIQKYEEEARAKLKEEAERAKLANEGKDGGGNSGSGGSNYPPKNTAPTPPPAPPAPTGWGGGAPNQFDDDMPF